MRSWLASSPDCGTSGLAIDDRMPCRPVLFVRIDALARRSRFERQMEGQSAAPHAVIALSAVAADA
jgi:hypothetical protein